MFNLKLSSYSELICVYINGACKATIWLMVQIRYRTAQTFDGGNFDEFDESKLPRQNFPYQYFKFQ